MNQKEINEAEWKNRDNWSGSLWASFYFSKKDSRTWVPKSIPWMGWTLNLGKPAGACWLVFFLAGLPTLMLLTLVLIIEAQP
jgi:uncharacterized membrane protein